MSKRRRSHAKNCIPSSIEEVFRKRMIISWHAGIRAIERLGIPRESDVIGKLLGIIRTTGTIVGSQYDDCILIHVTERHTQEEGCVVLEPIQDAWLIKTVLTVEMAVANFQSMNKRNILEKVYQDTKYQMITQAIEEQS